MGVLRRLLLTLSLSLRDMLRTLMSDSGIYGLFCDGGRKELNPPPLNFSKSSQTPSFSPFFTVFSAFLTLRAFPCAAAPAGGKYDTFLFHGKKSGRPDA